ncbi:hypothetical protein HX871_21465 [Pseudomonas reactans]|uniref:Uncharacterized protein n=1 Tax=Pseudomonas reactans TaxID=117680 RepID=A0ABX2QYV3_9PSED|nr:hypothetical protein [Pseudomonas reactans]NWD97002.1 hypothetical protein [Pseudomonas reactans]
MSDTPTAFDVQAKYPNDQTQRRCEERLEQLRTAKTHEQASLHYHQGKGYAQALSDAGLITRQEDGIISSQLLETFLLANRRLTDAEAQAQP